MSNIVVRTISGAVFIAIIITCVVLGGYYLMACLGVFSLVGMYEFVKMVNSKDAKLPYGLTLVSGLILYLTISLGAFSTTLVLAIAMLILIVNWSYYIWSQNGNPIVNVAYSTFGLLYCVLPFALMNLFSSVFSEHYYLLYLFLIVWTNDTFAYLSGRFFGKTKLFERISPKKTWEGTVGGLIFSAIASVIIAYFIGGNIVFWLISSQIIAVGAIVGDLFESLLKRSLEVKDSGTIIPGHGGILDRFDAAMFAAPLFFGWLLIYSIFTAL